jgi:acyl-homoserine-lactone acylase
VTVPPPALSLRSQLALQLLGSAKKKLTLEEVVRLKHSPRMLLADRVKPDLLNAARAAGDTALLEAVELLAGWDNTAAIAADGGVLFEAWWRRYLQTGSRGAPPYAEPWSSARPTETPRGLAEPDRALSALRAVIPELRRKYGRLGVTWGELHRVRFPGRDFPVAGCGGDLGCFRVLQFREDPDGKLVARGGDGWILAVEFGKEPRALSILAYSESQREGSPWRGDQAELFAKGELKPVAFLAKDVDAQAVRRYRPGRQ